MKFNEIKYNEMKVKQMYIDFKENIKNWLYENGYISNHIMIDKDKHKVLIEIYNKEMTESDLKKFEIIFGLKMEIKQKAIMYIKPMGEYVIFNYLFG